MRKTAWLIGILVLVLSFITILTGCISTPIPEDQVTLQLNWYHATEFIGYYTADAQGYYRDSNLNVKIMAGGPGIPARDYIINNQADFAVASFDEQKNLLAAGSPSVAVMTVFQIPPLVMFALADSGIKEPKDIIGKKVGIKNDYWRDIERKTLSNAGVDLSKVIEVTVKADAQNMLYDRQVDVWMGYAHDEPISAEISGHPVTKIYPADYGVGGYEGLLLTNTSMLHLKPDLVQRFVRASQRGLQYAMEHPDESAQLMTKWQPDESLEFYKLAVRAIIPLVDIPQSRIGTIDPVRWAQLMGSLYDTQNLGFTMQFLQEN
jgi:ABC-type nitrate/sulfonate/bicarbonate transport system substrate-binding protein